MNWREGRTSPWFFHCFEMLGMWPSWGFRADPSVDRTEREGLGLCFGRGTAHPFDPSERVFLAVLRLTVFTQSLVCWNPDLLVALMPPLGPHSPGVKDGTASPLPRCNLKDHTLGPLPSERCVKQAAQEASARASKEALEPAIVFHHNHKAGGTSIKSAFQTTLCRRPKSCILFQRNTSTLLTRRVLLKKERIKRDFLFTASMEEKMKVRLIVADRFWTGVCSFLPRPCLYFTTMRSPLYHHLSYWNFLCVGGQQNHMGWNATELRLGRCERPFIDWPISPTHLKMAGNSGGKHSHRMDPQALLAETVEHAKTKLRLFGTS